MADKTVIEWTDATWNPITGCAKVSQGCKNCYAERTWERLSANPKTVYFERAFTDVRCHPEHLDQPLRWSKPRRIFVNSMSDLFHPDVPFQFIADVFAVMSCTTRHTYQVLTKRPGRMLEFFSWLTFEEYPFFGWPDQVQATKVWPSWQPYREGKQGGYDNCGPSWPLVNVWLGVSVEDQATADERIPMLLQTPATVRWVSAEPLLGPICLYDWIGPWGSPGELQAPAMLDWVVAGGESGPKARPMHPGSARSLRDQCAAAGVPFLFKQWGEWGPTEVKVGGDLGGDMRRGTSIIMHAPGNPEGHFSRGDAMMSRIGKKRAGRLLDGVQHDGYPEAKR
ncbi:MAG: phage Gp37/Gp68 family protein [Betaproteobacteria bacterium]|nr:phage Gp37/Gp68 family protein [Betaproteobacteria bacterium]